MNVVVAVFDDVLFCRLVRNTAAHSDLSESVSSHGRTTAGQLSSQHGVVPKSELDLLKRSVPLPTRIKRAESSYCVFDVVLSIVYGARPMAHQAGPLLVLLAGCTRDKRHRCRVGICRRQERQNLALSSLPSKLSFVHFIFRFCSTWTSTSPSFPLLPLRCSIALVSLSRWWSYERKVD